MVRLEFLRKFMKASVWGQFFPCAELFHTLSLYCHENQSPAFSSTCSFAVFNFFLQYGIFKFFFPKHAWHLPYLENHCVIAILKWPCVRWLKKLTANEWRCSYWKWWCIFFRLNLQIFCLITLTTPYSAEGIKHA